MSRIAASRLMEVETGYYIRSGASLDQLWQPGGQVFFSSTYGRFTEALPNHEWDRITLQLFGSGGSTLGSDLARVNDFKSLAEQNSENQGASYYIHAPWPMQSQWNNWNDPVQNSASQLTRNQATYHDLFMQEIEAQHPNRFRMIPTGDVLAALRERVDNESIDWIDSISDVYRDHIHMNNLGRYIAAVTAYSVLYRDNPIGTAVPDTLNFANLGNWTGSELPSDVALEIQELVWEVVVDQQWTGVSPLGDVNQDTYLDQRDRQVLLDQFGFQENLTADANQDGIVDDYDRLIWKIAAAGQIGDYNDDFAIDQTDLELWTNSYGDTQPAGRGRLAADGNGDGVVDAADYTIARDAIAWQQAADFNQDGSVDQLDLAIWQNEEGWKSHLEGDLNDDGTVDAADLALFTDSRARYWRQNNIAPYATETTSIAVPEPSTLALLALMATAAATLRRS